MKNVSAPINVMEIKNKWKKSGKETTQKIRARYCIATFQMGSSVSLTIQMKLVREVKLVGHKEQSQQAIKKWKYS